jgi:tRNA pseudouridine38-40 synthase
MCRESEKVMRIALGISYDGTAYHGWQRQESATTLQSCVEDALSKVADHPVAVVCAGRTDRGVHALGQVVHFATTAQRDARAWTLGANANLPSDIRVHWAHPVTDNFHARFSAVARRYRYVIYNHATRPALLRNQVTTHFHLLNEQLMQEAASYLVGEHDFSSYRAMECQAKSPVRTISQLDVQRRADFIFIDIKANAFLHHMVRNIAGVLLAIGSGEQLPSWAKAVLEAKDRKQGGVTAPSQGLYFMEVFYPEEFALPKNGESSWLW